MAESKEHWDSSQMDGKNRTQQLARRDEATDLIENQFPSWYIIFITSTARKFLQTRLKGYIH